MAVMLNLKKKRYFQPQQLVNKEFDPSLLLAMVPSVANLGIELTTKTPMRYHYDPNATSVKPGKYGLTWVNSTTFDDVGTYNNEATSAKVLTQLTARASATFTSTFYLAPGRSSAVDIMTTTTNNVDFYVYVNTSGTIVVNSQGAGGANTATTTLALSPGYNTVSIEITSPAGSETREYKIWANGVDFGTYTKNWYTPWTSTTVFVYGPRSYNSVVHNSSTAEVYGIFLTAGVGRGQFISQNPWHLINVSSPVFLPEAISVYRPSSDDAVSGWSGVPGSSLYTNIDEVVYDDNDYVQSPDLATPTTFGLSSSLPIGSYDIKVRANANSTAQIRVKLLDSGNTVVGTSSWQSVSGSFNTYTLSVTITGIATKVKIEVQ